MDIMQLLITTLVYIVLFFLLEKVMVNEKSTIYYKLGYSLIFLGLIIFVNILSRQTENPPNIEVTIFQIILVVLIVISYLGYELYKLKSKKSNDK